MRLHKIFLSVILLTAAIFQSCEEDVKNFEANSTSQLVATSYISPQDTVHRVFLQRTQPALGKRLSEEGLKVMDATVTLSDGQNTVNLAYDVTNNSYFVRAEAFAIVADKTYFLKVITPHGDRAEASCTVPSLKGIQITEQNYSSKVIHSKFDNYRYTEQKFDFKWQDAPGIENYYRASVYRTHTEIYPPTVQGYKVSSGSYHDVAREISADTKSNDQVMKSNEFKFISDVSNEFSKAYHFHMVLSVCDKHYYLYHKSVYAQLQNDDNPFAEPTLIYSNMVGGIGVFAAYNQLGATKVIE